MSGSTSGEARQATTAAPPPDSVAPADPSMEDILASIRRILSEDGGAVAVPPAAAAPAPAAVPVAARSNVLVLDETMLVQSPEPAPPPPAPPPAALAEPAEADLAEMMIAQRQAERAADMLPPVAEPEHAATHMPPAADHTPAPLPDPLPDAEPAPSPDHKLPAPQMLDSNMPDLMTPDPAEAAPPDPSPTFHKMDDMMAHETSPPMSHPMSPPLSPPLSSRMDGPLVAPESAAATQAVVAALMRQLSTERTTPVYRAGPSIEDLVREEMRPLLKHWLDTHLPPMVERLVRGELDRLIARADP